MLEPHRPTVRRESPEARQVPGPDLLGIADGVPIGGGERRDRPREVRGGAAGPRPGHPPRVLAQRLLGGRRVDRFEIGHAARDQLGVTDLGEVGHAAARRRVQLGVEQSQNDDLEAVSLADGSIDGTNVGPPRRRDREIRHLPEDGAVALEENEPRDSGRCRRRGHLTRSSG